MLSGVHAPRLPGPAWRLVTERAFPVIFARRVNVTAQFYQRLASSPLSRIGGGSSLNWGGWRHITYDERARGKSRRAADYPFEVAVREVDAVLAARGVDWPLLVGWSYGAFVAAHWASRNPDRTVGAVLVDGAYPYDWLDEAMEQRIRKLFRWLSGFMPLLRPFGIAPRMNAGQQANSNMELGVISRERELGPVLDNITVPVRYVVASGTSFGSRGDEQERIRTSLDSVTARNLNIQISAKVASNHGAILRKDFRAIAEAVRETAAAHDQEVR
jgi:pimeloyl-ACP methyl ester carboxylesterase